MDYAIAVIDIGMTNKKVAIYDTKLTQLEAVYKIFEPLHVQNPLTKESINLHDLAGMENWFFEQIAAFAKKYPIRAISVTTHGATFVCLDKSNQVCTPCILYTHEPGAEFQKEFYDKFGDKISLQKETFTPPFEAMINPAKGIFYLQKYFAADFAKTATILYYPQYWNFLFTGKTGIEPTFAGCHTYLWNHKKNEPSVVAKKLGVEKLFSSNYKNTCETLGTLTDAAAKRLGLPTDTLVTMGVHDSNASLLPYLAKEAGDFVLNSTGTWCVCMHPQKDLHFNEEDLGKIVFFNQSVFRDPVKTAIFLGGMEFDEWTALYKKANKTEEFPQFTEQAVNKLLAEQDCFLLPEIVQGSGQFSSSKPGIWQKKEFYSFDDIKTGKRVPPIIHDEAAFIAVLDLSLVIQTETALQRAGLKKGTKVFTEGGFRKNKLYNALLASILHDNEYMLTSMQEATAFGAAMTAVMAKSNMSHKELTGSISITYTPVAPGNFLGYKEYKQRWLQLAESKSATLQ